ncbi:hypothetical protein QVD17_26173 [Tagetes erecta]|uniref:Uncharacterized protein n=1 Tax=Tagetes erecta TaxID=13708 RepID=A0AAD8K8V9_TARER|nr:hypothetical protein QVD17_26173 [Tagetes erecta]
MLYNPLRRSRGREQVAISLKPSLSLSPFTPSHTYTYTHICVYIYMCVCVYSVKLQSQFSTSYKTLFVSDDLYANSAS